MAEKIDIYNANLEFKGVMDRLEAHMGGEWHETFHCWVVNGGNKSLLFQVRSKEMVNFPNMLDVSAAGHLTTGEKTDDGIREVSEELGIPVEIGSMYFLGYRVEVADQSNGQKNREYQAVYLIRYDSSLAEYVPQEEEIAGLVWVDINDGMRLFSEEVDAIIVNGISYDKTNREWVVVEREVNQKDFLPRKQQYYLTMCIMAERLLEERFPLAIS